MAHLKAITHINVFFFSIFTIRKCDIALKTTLLAPIIKWKTAKVQNRYYCDSYIQSR